MLIVGRDTDTVYGASAGGILKILPGVGTEEVRRGFASYTNESIAEDKYGRFWLGSSQNNTLQIYDNGDVELWQDSLINIVISLASDVRQNIWIGNHDGVFLYDYKTVRKIAPNIIRTPIYNIIPYNDSTMVLGSGQQLFTINLKDLYDRNKETITRNAPNSGFTAEECVQNTYCITRDSALFIPATNLCYRFFPLEFEPLAIPLAPNIVSVKFSDKEQHWEKFTAEQQPDKLDRNLSFFYVSIHFKEQDNMRYRYRLLGYQKSWSDDTKERSVSYDNLSFGDYRFEVQGSIDGVNWSQSTFSNEITLPRQLAETYFFRILFLALFGSIIFFVSRRYFALKRKNAIKRERQAYEVTNLQLSNIKSQLNPHFIFNVMNHVGASIVKNEREDAYDYFVKLSQLIRENLKESEKPVKTLETELAFIQKYLGLQKYRFGERLQFITKIDEAIDKQMLVPRMCLQILVENAVKHGLESLRKVGELTIFGKKEEAGIVLGVADNGKGFSKKISSEGNGKGLESLIKILKIYNAYNEKEAKLYIASDEKGSIVSIQIPTGYQFSFVKSNKKVGDKGLNEDIMEE